MKSARFAAIVFFNLVVGLSGIAARAGTQDFSIEGQDSISDASTSASAAAPSKPAARDGVAATIVTDGAMIYAGPDFDAAVISQLPKGQKIRVSKGTAGDQARFHKLRVGKKIGYVADIDVSLDGSGNVAASQDAHGGKKTDKYGKKKNGRKNARSKKDKKDAPEKDPNANPIYFTRFVGLLVGFTEFKEGISGVDAKTTFPYYGLKVTGPDVLIAGPVLDFNLALHYGAPTYYESLSATRPIGFVMFTDLLLMLPILNRQDSMIYLEGGPLLVWSKFSVFNSGRLLELNNLNLGGAIALGGAHRVGKIGLRLEAKYFVEKQQYKAIQFALQTGF